MNETMTQRLQTQCSLRIVIEGQIVAAWYPRDGSGYSVKYNTSLTPYLPVGEQYCKPSARFLGRKCLYSGIWLLEQVKWMRYSKYLPINVVSNAFGKIEEIDRS